MYSNISACETRSFFVLTFPDNLIINSQHRPARKFSLSKRLLRFVQGNLHKLLILWSKNWSHVISLTNATPKNRLVDYNFKDIAFLFTESE